MDYTKELQKIYDSEINYSISSFWDDGFLVELGDHFNGFKKSKTVKGIKNVVLCLIRWCIDEFPNSSYSQNKIFFINKLRSGLVDTDKFTDEFLFGMIEKMEETMKNKKIECCFEKCNKPAEFEIRENTRTDPDNYTLSCEEHVGKMLGATVGFPKCGEWSIFLIPGV